jgi:hypothetical protein
MKNHVMNIFSSLLNIHQSYGSVQKDIVYFEHRLKKEGLPFLTVALPKLGDWLDKSLSNLCLGPGSHLKMRPGTNIPLFLGGLFSRIFKDCGALRKDPDIEAIRLLRQIFRMYKKVEIPCTDSAVINTLNTFVATDKSLGNQDEVDLSIYITHFADVFSKIESKILNLDLIPKHGPGATNTRGAYNTYLGQNERFEMLNWNNVLEEYFPQDHYAYVNHNAWLSCKENISVVDYTSQSVRIVGVPKTAKGPRLIGIEPTHNMWIQQAIKGELYKLIEDSPHVGGHINFTNQSINNRLAREGSVSGETATIDMSQASDRVGLRLVERTFRNHPTFVGAIKSCRTPNAEIEIDGINTSIQLNMFAPCGNALTFPLEAIIFNALALHALTQVRQVPPTLYNLRMLQKEIYIYGDDIIIPIDAVGYFEKAALSLNMVMNNDKSFWSGNFRESCGGDYYMGHNVTPVYVRRLPPRNRKQSAEVLSWIDLGNQLYLNGYWKTATIVRSLVEDILGSLPVISTTSAAIGWVTVTDMGSYPQLFCKTRVNKNTFHREAKVLAIVNQYNYDDYIDSYPALLKTLLAMESKTPVYSNGKIDLEAFAEGDIKHLERSTARGVARIKRLWIEIP